MQIEEGKYYVSRGGNIYGPATIRDRFSVYRWRLAKVGGGNPVTVTSEGRYYNEESQCPLDLIKICDYTEPTKLPDEYGLAHWQKAFANFERKQRPWQL